MQLRVDEGGVPVHCDDATTAPFESTHCTVSVCVPAQLHAVGLLATQLAVAVCVPHTPALHTEPDAEHRVLSSSREHTHAHKPQKNSQRMNNERLNVWLSCVGAAAAAPASNRDRIVTDPSAICRCVAEGEVIAEREKSQQQTQSQGLMSSSGSMSSRSNEAQIPCRDSEQLQHAPIARVSNV